MAILNHNIFKLSIQFYFREKIVCLSSLVVDSKNHSRLAIPLPLLNKKKLPVLLKTRRKIYFTDSLAY